MKRTFAVKTRLDKKAKEQATNLTMDYTGVTVDDLIGPAEDSLVIVMQGRWRRAKSIPPQLTVKVKELIGTLGKRMVQVATPEGLKSVFLSMSAEDKAKFLKAVEEAAQQAQQQPK